MLEAFLIIIIALSIMAILFFAFMTKNKLAALVAFTILAAVAVSMFLNGLVGLIIDIDFLSFLVSFFRFLNDIVVFVELGVILFLLFMSKYKSKIMLLKVAIIVYVVLTLLVEMGVL